MKKNEKESQQPSEEEIVEKLEALYLTAKRPLHRIAAKAIKELLIHPKGDAQQPSEGEMYVECAYKDAEYSAYPHPTSRADQRVMLKKAPQQPSEGKRNRYRDGFDSENLPSDMNMM